ncbi:MAG: hypothetical protein V3T31_13040 [candidate division Zixibacteria bacterium]
MKQRFVSFTTLVVFCLATLIWVGCSDDTITTVISADDYVNDQAESYYLPLAEGFTTVYSVTSSDGTDKIIRLEVGKQVQLGSMSAVEWISDDGITYDTGYVRITLDAVFFYDGANSDAEKILELPLITGGTWERFSDDYDNADDFTDIITIFDPNDTTSILEGTLAKTFPSTGGNTMVVVGQEQLQLGDGSTFSSAVKVYNESSVPGKKNYYWYVEHIGLVKYVLGTTDGSFPRGDVVGELIDYGN